MTAKEHAEMSDKTTAIPKTYDAIKSAAGAEMKVKGKRCKNGLFSEALYITTPNG